MDYPQTAAGFDLQPLAAAGQALGDQQGRRSTPRRTRCDSSERAKSCVLRARAEQAPGKELRAAGARRTGAG